MKFFSPSKRAANQRRRDRQSSDLDYQICEPRQLLATLADAGISQRVIDLLNNQGQFAGQFEGDVGSNNNGVADVSYSSFVLNDPALQHTVDAIAATETAPAGATLITTKTQLLNNINSGSVANPNVYLVQGDFTLTNNETIDVPSNVEIYIDGSIFKEGTFSAIGVFNNGNGGESENNVSYIFRVNNSDNVKLIGIDNAKLHSTPTTEPNQPHATAIRIEGNATDVVVDGFEMEFLWQGVDARFGTRNITTQNNYIHDIVKRAIWYLGTSDSVATHNFVVNAGADGIDFDAFTADSLAYENILIGSGRFAYFVEEGANNNFSVRNLSILFRLPHAHTGFMLGNASNGTSSFFAGNNPGEFTRDNFFVDNATFQPSGQRNQQGGGFIAADNAGAGNTYFYGNRRFGISDPGEGPAGDGRDLAHKAIIEDRLPSGIITTANDVRFDDPDGFHEYDLVDLLTTWDATYNVSTTPIRSDLLPEPIEDLVYAETNGLVVIEAETFTTRVGGTGSATGRHWNLLSDDTFGGSQGSSQAASGDFGLIAERNFDTSGFTNLNTALSLDGPRVDYDILFSTPGTYNVFIRTQSFNPGSNSVQLGLNGTSFTNSDGFGVGIDSDTWNWTGDVIGSTQGITVNVTEAGIHTLNVWMREDGVEIDKIVLEVGGLLPTGFGPAESNRVSPVLPPKVANVSRDGAPIDQLQSLVRPDLLDTVSITFDKDVNINQGFLPFALINETTGDFVSIAGGDFSYDSNTMTATFDWSGLNLEPAFYSLGLNPFAITGVDGSGSLDGDGDNEAGGEFSQEFYVVLPGDLDYDGDVDVLDADGGDGFAFLPNIGLASGATWSDGDFNGDGAVDILGNGTGPGDGFILIANLGQSVVPPANSLASSRGSDSSLSSENSSAVVTPTAESVAPVVVTSLSWTLEQDEPSTDQPLPSANVSQNLTLAGSHELDDAFADEFLF